MFIKNFKIKTKLKTIKTLLGISVLIYPFAIFFLDKFLNEILLFMLILWAIRVKISSIKQEKFLAIFCVIFFSLNIISKGNFSYFYPVLVNLIFLIVFYFSLKNEAIITKIAKLKDKNLPKIAEIYTKDLTKIWCLFFLINGLLCAILAIFENKIYWVFYTGFLSYIFIGILFLGEMILRKKIIGKFYER